MQTVCPAFAHKFSSGDGIPANVADAAEEEALSAGSAYSNDASLEEEIACKKACFPPPLLPSPPSVSSLASPPPPPLASRLRSPDTSSLHS